MDGCAQMNVVSMMTIMVILMKMMKGANVYVVE